MKKDVATSNGGSGNERETVVVKRRLAPKGYIHTLDLLAKVVRNSEYIEADYKESLLDQLILRWSLLARRGISEWDAVTEHFIRRLDIDAGPNADGFRQHVGSIGRKVVPIGFAGIFAGAVANPILSEILRGVIDDKGRIWLERFFGFAALVEADLPTGLAAGRELAVAVRQQKPVGWKFLLHLMAGRLYELRHSRSLPRDLHEAFTSLAIEIELGLGLPRSRRNLRASDIRGELVKGLVKH